MSQTQIGELLHIWVVMGDKERRSLIDGFVAQLRCDLAASYSSAKQCTADCLKPQFPPSLVVTDVSDHKALMQIRTTLMTKRLLEHLPIILIVLEPGECETSQDVPEVFICHVTPITIDQFHGHLVRTLKNFDHLKEQLAALAAVSQQLADVQQRLEDRAIIERAKGYIMKRTGCNEDVAYKHLLKKARDENASVAATAQKIVTYEEAFYTLE